MSLQLARPDLLSFVPYSSARKEAKASGILLNANEWPWAPYAGGNGLNRYPQPQPPALVERLAQIYAVEPAQLLVGRGSDEAIDLLVRGFCRAGHDSIVISPPTFGMYRVSAQLQNAAVIEVPLLVEQDYALDTAAVLAAARKHGAKLVFVCSPNNPTGQLANREEVLRLVDQLADSALVVIDEAYVEFAAAASYSTELSGRANLLILRTLSKAYGLAAARIGSLIGEPSIIAFLRGLMAPYPLPGPSVEAALRGLDPALDEARKQHLQATLDQRERLRTALGELECVTRMWPSDANFLCLQLRNPAPAKAALSAADVVIRDLSRYPGLANCVRVSIGTQEENTALIDALTVLPQTELEEPSR